MVECKCGYKFNTVEGYKNFRVEKFEKGHWVMICPVCGKRVVGEGI